LALSLARRLREKGRLNQQLGGRQKGLSNLAKDERINTRDYVARTVSVGTGTVTMVQQILANAMAQQVMSALRSGEISIHFAWKNRKDSRSEQIDAIGRKRHKREASQKLFRLAKGKGSISSSNRESLQLIASGLKGLCGFPGAGQMLNAFNDWVSSLTDYPESLKESSYGQQIHHQANPG
jgi:hypothetical protein